MFDSAVLAIAIAVCLYVGYLLVKAYMPSLFQKKAPVENFVSRTAMGPPMATPINVPSTPIPAPAPSIAQAAPQEERIVAPGGPGAPNATALPDVPATISPEVNPIDPYDDKNMEAPIHDSMRFPELSFGPGVENKGTVKAAASGVANARGVTSESPFSPEFAQNGGIFMGSVSANDLSHDDTYANA
jgi:hypothetical protein